MTVKTYVKEEITHQGIGGQEIDIEFRVDMFDVIFKGLNGNPACKNFLDRRDGEALGAKYKEAYYGKVGHLGYIVTEDELINPPNPKEVKKEHWVR